MDPRSMLKNNGSFGCTLFRDISIDRVGIPALDIRGGNKKQVEHGFCKGKRGSQGDGIGSKRVGMTDTRSQEI